MAKDATPDTWTGTITAWWPVAMTLVTTAICIFLGIVAGPIYFLLLLAVLPTIVLGKVRIDIGPEEMRLGFGPAGWPAKRFAIEDLVRAEAIDLTPIQWGGWGYRWMPGRTAVVLRKGSAIAVEKTDGKLFAVTVDDADRGANVLQKYLS